MSVSGGEKSDDCCCFANGWWCRGCGGCSKREKLALAGYSATNIDKIYDFQFAGCDQPFAPCFICNRDGKKKCTMKGCTFIPMFWQNFKLKRRKGKKQNDAKIETPPKKFCKSCDEGWWCGGCGSVSKREALNHHGFTKNQVEHIYSHQKGKCTDPYVPCFICNHDGDIPCREADRSVQSLFWSDYVVPDAC